MEIIDETLIMLDIDLRSKNDVIEAIADTLDSCGRLNDRKQFIRDVLAREEVVSTYIGDQIVIPHARSVSVRTASLVYVRLKEPVAWNVSEQAKYIFNIAVPEKNDENDQQKGDVGHRCRRHRRLDRPNLITELHAASVVSTSISLKVSRSTEELISMSRAN